MPVQNICKDRNVTFPFSFFGELANRHLHTLVLIFSCVFLNLWPNVNREDKSVKFALITKSGHPLWRHALLQHSTLRMWPHNYSWTSRSGTYTPFPPGKFKGQSEPVLPISTAKEPALGQENTLLSNKTNENFVTGDLKSQTKTELFSDLLISNFSVTNVRF